MSVLTAGHLEVSPLDLTKNPKESLMSRSVWSPRGHFHVADPLDFLDFSVLEM